MFCPKCAAQNVEDAKFCRGCGSDISLVPQALTGHLRDEVPSRHRHRREKTRPTIENAVQSIFMGLAFIFVAFAAKSWAPAGHIWWFWMFLPAFSMLGRGVALYMRMKEDQRRLAPPAFAPAQQAVPPPAYAAGLPARDTGEIIPPPSVTEGTTRHLGVPVERGQKNP